MNIDTRLKRVESALKEAGKSVYSTVVFIDECPTFDSCIVTIAGERYQGTKEEMDTLLKPYIEGGSVIIYEGTLGESRGNENEL